MPKNITRDQQESPSPSDPILSSKFMLQLISTTLELASYRRGMKIQEVLILVEYSFSAAKKISYAYYKCPRCKGPMEGEFVSFCDRCGQKLDWRGYRKAKEVYPGKETYEARFKQD